MAYPESHCRIGCKRVKGGFLDLSEYKDATDNEGVHRHSKAGCIDQRWLHTCWHCKRGAPGTLRG